MSRGVVRHSALKAKNAQEQWFKQQGIAGFLSLRTGQRKQVLKSSMKIKMGL